MKVYYLFSILLVVLGTTFTKSIINKRDGVNSKTKRAETSDECKYINSMLGKSESYNCCDYDSDSGGSITCENGYIIKL